MELTTNISLHTSEYLCRKHFHDEHSDRDRLLVRASRQLRRLRMGGDPVKTKEAGWRVGRQLSNRFPQRLTVTAKQKSWVSSNSTIV